jgi:hypothetical protein
MSALDEAPRRGSGGIYGSDEFNAAYQAAVSGEKPVAPGAPAKDTLAWLIGLHRKSGYWDGLAKATKKKRDQIFTQVLKTSGKLPISSVDKKAVEDARD